MGGGGRINSRDVRSLQRVTVGIRWKQWGGGDGIDVKKVNSARMGRRAYYHYDARPDWLKEDQIGEQSTRTMDDTCALLK